MKNQWEVPVVILVMEMVENEIGGEIIIIMTDQGVLIDQLILIGIGREKDLLVRVLVRV